MTCYQLSSDKNKDNPGMITITTCIYYTPASDIIVYISIVIHMYQTQDQVRSYLPAFEVDQADWVIFDLIKPS